jgi:hypothetical protein
MVAFIQNATWSGDFKQELAPLRSAQSICPARKLNPSVEGNIQAKHMKRFA